MIERLNEVNLRITEIIEEHNYKPKELLNLMWEREELMDNINKEENECN